MSGTIEIQNFSKNYGDVTAVDNLSLTVESGELFGLIGPDGAGKTTTMRTICTLLPCESGNIFVDGMDVRKEIPAIRSILGYMPERFSLYPDLSVAQNLNFFADLFGVPADEKETRLTQLYKFSRLEPFKNRLTQALSGGMKQKLALSCTLIHKPKILILDEPTTGVDPVSRREFWQILKQLRDDGVTILVSTPYMDEASLCDRVAFLYRGEMMALDKPQQLSGLFPYSLYEVTGREIRKLYPYFLEHPEVQSAQVFGSRLHVSFVKKPATEALAKMRNAAPQKIDDIKLIEPSIEDTFLALMKQRETNDV